MTARPSDEPRFEEVTETTGTPVSAEGASMMYTRYRWAADLAQGRRVLELACGSGQGLGLLGRAAARLVGGDVSRPLLRAARTHYGRRFSLARLSAERLPFASAAFDVVLCFEASYYMPRMADTFRDIARVLAPAGVAVFVNANPERPDFIASPHSIHYHTADEFRAALGALDLDVTVEGAFPLERGDGALSVARRVLERLGLVPRTLAGRARLKRLIYGRLTKLPPELPEGFAAVAPRVAVGPGPVRDFKVIYVIGRKSAQRRLP
jgi:SAM-dependent methyltransferase